MIICGPLQDSVMEENVCKMKQQFVTAHGIPKEGHIKMKEVLFMIVPALAIAS